MKRIVVKYKDGSIREILEKLMEEFDDYRKEETQQDDVTVFGFRV